MSRVPMKVDGGPYGSKRTDVNYPSNSDKSKREASEPGKEPAKLAPVVKGKTVRKKKGFFSKAKDVFIGEDVENVGEYIMYDVVIPAVKNTIADLIIGSISMTLFGDAKHTTNTYRDKGKSYVSYNNYYKNKESGRQQRTVNKRAMHSFDDIILESKGEAEQVLDLMVDRVLDYDRASVANLYDLVNMNSTWQDHKFGWEDLSSAYVSRVREGYLLVLPKPIEL